MFWILLPTPHDGQSPFINFQEYIRVNLYRWKNSKKLHWGNDQNEKRIETGRTVKNELKRNDLFAETSKFSGLHFLIWESC